VEQSWWDLDTSDREEVSVHQPTSEELQEKIKRRQERQQRDRGFVQESTARGATPRSLTDPDRRSRPKSLKVEVGDHVQLAVDSQPQLMVAQEVTHAIIEDAQLSPMAMSAKQTLRGTPLWYDHTRPCSGRWPHAGAQARARCMQPLGLG
jgi:hypothetical protein